MGKIAAASRPANVVVWPFTLLGLGLLALLLLTLQKPFSSDGSPAVVTGNGSFIAYFQFGSREDTLWQTDPLNPNERSSILKVQHAPEYGVVPSLSPDGSRVAYMVLASDSPAPGPDAPAQLWLTGLRSGVTPLQLADNVDLLVPAVWSADGSRLVFRRSDSKTADGSHELRSIQTSGGSERLLARSQDALFPVALTAKNPASGRETLYYVRLTESGSFLHSLDIAGGSDTQVAQLSGGLSRDWTLSEDGRKLAYLSLSFTANEVLSRAYVLDLVTGESSAVGEESNDAFSPSWDAKGNLLIGQLGSESPSYGLTVIGPAQTQIAAPQRGFDVPLATDANSGLIAVRSFDGLTTTRPGRAVLVVIDQDGARHQIASGEVTFLGWISP